MGLEALAAGAGAGGGLEVFEAGGHALFSCVSYLSILWVGCIEGLRMEWDRKSRRRRDNKL